jgi:undecaprenyl-diphosphatase
MFSAFTHWDATLLGWISAAHTPWLDTLMSAATIAGIMAGIWQLLALVSLCFAGRRAAAWRALMAIWLGLFVVDVLIKPAIGRPRPAAGLAADARLQWAEDAERRGLAPASNTYSFPSGHATSAFVGAIMISQIWPSARVVFWAIALMICYSRMYLGHHYPLDILGGAVLGTTLAYWVTGGRIGARRVPV